MIQLRDRTRRVALPEASTVVRAGIRGLSAAMAMTGVRTVTSNARLVRKTPPVAIVERHGPRGTGRMDPGYRAALTELAHWGYGGVGGAVYGCLPARLRAHPATGPVYGLLVWLGFEMAIAPILGVERENRGPVGRLMVALDHLLYGALVGDRMAPEPSHHAPAS